ncbi:hypothetical protein EB796_022621 [Bugula neritina]|uniref:Uncharacterized protein n=1 Tax=Bugula neritina TaxID=10212 RepID=A0A7J7IZW3_BUGNE|nr:hypothetical protein EB796_022621 [Bugula neritina]
MSSETERVLDVTGPGTPAGKEDGLLSEILEAQGTSTAGATGTMEAATVSETPTSSATLSSSAPDNNNNRIKEGRRRVSNKNNNKKPKKQTIHYSVITPKSLDYSKFKGPQPQVHETHHIPLPPPLPAEDDMVSGMPPLPPPPFQ